MVKFSACPQIPIMWYLLYKFSFRKQESARNQAKIPIGDLKWHQKELFILATSSFCKLISYKVYSIRLLSYAY